MASSFETLYPNAAYFADAIGWIEFGRNDDIPLTSFIRAIDMGGMIWEGKDEYDTIDSAFQDLEKGLIEWMNREGIKRE